MEEVEDLLNSLANSRMAVHSRGWRYCAYCHKSEIEGILNHDKGCLFVRAKKLLKTLPRWTPVSEGLPEFSDDLLRSTGQMPKNKYWVTLFDGQVEAASYGKDGFFVFGFVLSTQGTNLERRYDHNEVIAYRTYPDLPAPYQPDEDVIHLEAGKTYQIDAQIPYQTEKEGE